MCRIPRLFFLLNERGISQKQLSDIIETSTGNITDWKSGRSAPTIEKLIAISDFLNVSLDYLLGKSDMKSPHLHSAEAMPDDIMDIARTLQKLSESDKSRVKIFAEALAETTGKEN